MELDDEKDLILFSHGKGTKIGTSLYLTAPRKQNSI
jgi:hypothetical protein